MSVATDPVQRLGVFKTLSDVPDEYRFEKFESEYRDRDLWGEFEEQQCGQFTSTYFQEGIERAGRRWKTHMADRGRHHAFAVPDDVETWADGLLDGAAVNTVYNNYWTRLEAFYDWLLWSPEYPHRYSPVLMAAAQTDAGRTVWEEKMNCR